MGGLLVGLAATVAGCGERHSPAVMGRFPDSRYQENAKNEDKEVFVIEGEMPEPEDIQAQGQEPSETNAVREVQGKDPVLLGKPPSLPPQTNAVQEQQRERNIRGRIVPPVTTNAVNEADDEAVVMGGVGGDS